MKLNEFRDILKQAGVPVYKDYAHKQDGRYIVWYEIKPRSLRAEGGTAEKNSRFGVDFFTKEDVSDIPVLLENIFAQNDIAYSDYDVDFEEDTKYTHYAWTVEA